MINFKKAITKRDLFMMLIIVSLVVVIGFFKPVFFGLDNLNDIFNDTSILFIMVLGQALVIITRGIDLSVASIMALTGMSVALINSSYPDLSLLLLLLFSLSLGLILGMVNAALVVFGKITPIVVTLGTMSIYRGITFLLNDGEWVSSHEMTKEYLAAPLTEFMGFSYLEIIAVVVIAVFFIFMHYTKLGREFYAVGGNPTACTYLGINKRKVEFYSYCISGLLAGICGYLWVARYSIAYTGIASGFELQIIAACVIGGISILGGAGTAIGAILGALFLNIIYSSLPILQISPFWQMGIAGSVILIAVAIHSDVRRKK